MYKNIGTGLWTCTTCGFAKQKKCHVNEHLSVHDQTRRFVCNEPICYYRFDNYKALRQHQTVVHLSPMVPDHLIDVYNILCMSYQLYLTALRVKQDKSIHGWFVGETSKWDVVSVALQRELVKQCSDQKVIDKGEVERDTYNTIGLVVYAFTHDEICAKKVFVRQYIRNCFCNRITAKKHDLTPQEQNDILTTIRNIPLLTGWVLDSPYTYDKRCLGQGQEPTASSSIPMDTSNDTIAELQEELNQCRITITTLTNGNTTLTNDITALKTSLLVSQKRNKAQSILIKNLRRDMNES